MARCLDTGCMVSLLAVVAMGCGSAPEERENFPSSRDLPRLERVEFELPDVDQPITTRSIALTADGYFVYFRDNKDAPLLVTLDSNGNVISRWGRTGEGPGELQGDEFLHSGDAKILLLESEGRIAKVFDPGGRLVTERRNVPAGFASELNSDSVDIWRGFRVRSQTDDRVLEDRPGSFDRVCIMSNCVRTLLPADDSIVRRVHGASPRSGAWPAVAAEPGRFVVSDAFAYRLWMFTGDGTLDFSFGRDVLPRMATQAERDRLDS